MLRLIYPNLGLSHFIFSIYIPGTGLGLVIVKIFVERNNGKVYIKSKLNVGTTATIELPIYHKNV